MPNEYSEAVITNVDGMNFWYNYIFNSLMGINMTQTHYPILDEDYQRLALNFKGLFFERRTNITDIFYSD